MSLDPRVHALRNFTPNDWYWHITDGAHRPDDPRTLPLREQVYSSAKGGYVPATDPDYVAWMNAEPVDRTTHIDTEEHLKAVLEMRDLKFGVPAD